MCDYSLAYFPSRLAVDGESLAVHRFPCGTLGLTGARRSWKQILFPGTTCAVCVPPGARLLVHDIPGYLQRQLGVGSCEEVTFVEQTAEAFTHRDAVRFSNGREILLQRLQAGQRVLVIGMESNEEPEPNWSRNQEHRSYFAGTEKRF